MDGHLGCSHVVAVVNSAAVNTGVHVPFSILFFSGYMLSSRIVGSYDTFIPRFLRILHTVFCSCTAHFLNLGIPIYYGLNFVPLLRICILEF